jgi:hypothetical protein
MRTQCEDSISQPVGRAATGRLDPRGKRVEHRVLFKLDVGVPVPDGVVLRGDLYRADTAEPSPALLGWSPYNKDLMPTGLPAPFNEPGAVGYLASRGYAVLVAGARGTGRRATTSPVLAARCRTLGNLLGLAGAGHPRVDTAARRNAAGHGRRQRRAHVGGDPRTPAAPPEQGFVYFEVAGPPYPARNTVSHLDATLRLSVRGEPP